MQENTENINLWQYYLNKASSISDNALKKITSFEEWKKQHDNIYENFLLSAGVESLPEKCDLKITTKGEINGKGYKALKLAYQIYPGCWGSGIIYFPKSVLEGKAPAVLYACGHKNIGVHGYQAHAAMWARRGYVCFIFDTIEQHDNLGEHHGLHSKNRLDWISLGYSGLTGELLNSIRALDVLESFEEVDSERIGVTGNSGGGAISFYLTIIDQRIKCSAPSCGVPSIKQTISERHFLHHCDCIYYHNIFSKDTSEYGALIAPRPLLFLCATEDMFFSPLEFRSLVKRIRTIYDMHGETEKCALFEYRGPHGYHPLSVKKINEWFDEHLAKEKHPNGELEQDDLSERETSVFNGIQPIPNHLALLPELLCPSKGFKIPDNINELNVFRDSIKKNLMKSVFISSDAMKDKSHLELLGKWLRKKGARDVIYKKYRGSIGNMEIWLESFFPKNDVEYVLIGVEIPLNSSENIFDSLWPFFNENIGIITLEPRATSLNSYSGKVNLELLRAGALTGATLNKLHFQDLEIVLKYLSSIPEVKNKKIILIGDKDAGVMAMYHSLFNKNIHAVIASNTPSSHKNGTPLLNVLKVVDIPYLIGLQAPRVIGLINPEHGMVSWAKRVYSRLKLSHKFICKTSLSSVISEITQK